MIALGLIVLYASEVAVSEITSQPTQAEVARLIACAPCHAIDRVGESPLPIAPLFRALRLKYPGADLQRPLAEGIHLVMLRFQLEPGQISDLRPT